MARGFDELVHHVLGTWAVTPYRLCDYRCAYCCTNVQGASEPVMPREDALDVLDRMLTDAGPDSFWAIGGLGDAYPRAEERHVITRDILRLVIARGVRWCLVTKSRLVERDLDLLRAAGDRGLVTVSISSLDDAELAKVDGFAPSASERLELVHRLHAAGVPVDVNALPYLPGLTDLGALLERVPAGVRVTVSPLLFGEGVHRMVLAGRTYVRSEVWDAYLADYERLGHLEHLSWIRPALPPAENNPLVRLPTLAAPVTAASALRRDLRALAAAAEDAPDPAATIEVALAAPVRR